MAGSRLSDRGRYMVKQRIDWLDIGKGIAIVLVVLGHCLDFESPVKHAIFSFHMPLFFIFAGYTFRVKPVREMAVLSAKRLLIPFLILFMLTALSALMWSGDSSIDFALREARSFVFASAVNVKWADAPAVGAIWFFVVLFEARIAMNALQGFFERREVSMALQATAYAVLALCGIAVGKVAFLPFSLDIVSVAMLFMFGGYVSRRYDLIRFLHRPAILLGLLVIWAICLKLSWLSMGDRFFSIVPFSIIGAFAATAIVARVSMAIEHFSPLRHVFVYLGVNSLSILALHHVEINFIPWSQTIQFSALPFGHLLLFAFKMFLILSVLYLLTSDNSVLKKTKA